MIQKGIDVKKIKIAFSIGIPLQRISFSAVPLPHLAPLRATRARENFSCV